MNTPAASELTVGFIPLLDCALLVVAAEKGFAAQNGLSLRLQRESSWANIRDRVAVGHFDAAHMLGPMVVAETLGAGQINVPLVAPVALGLGGNAVTVSRELWSGMCRHGARVGGAPGPQALALARVIADRTARGQPPLVLAMVFPFSCHNYELRYWLASAGIDPDRDVRLIVLPPPLLVDALRTGQIDGFCVGEPWSSVAVDAGLGVIAAVASDIWRWAPEKVLGMRADYAARHPDRVVGLVRAIEAASRWTTDPGNRAELAQLLSEPRYVGVPARLLHEALEGRIRLISGEPPIERPEFFLLNGHDATVPWPEQAGWFYSQMRLWGQIEREDGQLARAMGSFRSDLYVAALAGTAMSPREDLRPHPEAGAFFDSRPFDVTAIEAYLDSFFTRRSHA